MQQQTHSLNPRHESFLSFYPTYFGGNLGQQGWVSTFELAVLVVFSQEEEKDLPACNSSYLKRDT